MMEPIICKYCGTEQVHAFPNQNFLCFECRKPNIVEIKADQDEIDLDQKIEITRIKDNQCKICMKEFEADLKYNLCDECKKVKRPVFLMETSFPLNDDGAAILEEYWRKKTAGTILENSEVIAVDSMGLKITPLLPANYEHKKLRKFLIKNGLEKFADWLEDQLNVEYLKQNQDIIDGNLQETLE